VHPIRRSRRSSGVPLAFLWRSSGVPLAFLWRSSGRSQGLPRTSSGSSVERRSAAATVASAVFSSGHAPVGAADGTNGSALAWLCSAAPAIRPGAASLRFATPVTGSVLASVPLLLAPVGEAPAFVPRSSASGCQALAFGCQALAFGCQVLAFGCQALAFGCQALAFGCQALAFGCQALAFGCQALASVSAKSAFGCQALAFGCQALASVSGKSAFGCQALASVSGKSAFGGVRAELLAGLGWGEAVSSAVVADDHGLDAQAVPARAVARDEIVDVGRRLPPGRAEALHHRRGERVLRLARGSFLGLRGQRTVDLLSR